MTKETTAAFTGHRNLPDDPADLIARTRDTIASLANRGILHFCCGGAIGYDLLAAEIVLNLKNHYPLIQLHQILPFRGQELKWNPEQQKNYHRINSQADQVTYLAERYTGNQLYHIRNRTLVDRASYLIAYCTNYQARSGTASCCRYAMKQGVPIIRV